MSRVSPAFAAATQDQDTPMLDMGDSTTNSSSRVSPSSITEASSATSITVSIANSDRDASKGDTTIDEVMEEENDKDRRRSVRSRKHIPTYNDKMLSGYAVHTRRGYRKEDDPFADCLTDMETLKRTVSGVTLVDDDSPSKQLLAESNKALDNDVSQPTTPRSAPQPTRRKSLRTVVASASTVLGKRSRDVIESAKDKLQELGRTASLRSRAPKPAPKAETTESPPKKKQRMFPNLQLDTSESEESESEEESDLEPEQKRQKLWLGAGLYAGQTREPIKIKGKNRKSIVGEGRERQFLPLPMYKGLRMLEEGHRHFQLPYDVVSPLPRAEHPKDWRNVVKNRFVGDAIATWNKDKETLSKCQCEAETGCDEDCLNRTMRYECNTENCNVGAEHCSNRSFAELKWRKEGKNWTRQPAKKESNLWGEGIEVTQAGDRGYGVRAMRSFEPGQIIIEYTGEIITQEEADRRMNDEYKEHQNYYMMTFHRGLIIDGYRGSICRFVNHSCDPNCAVEKWTVDGQPRMALFAGPDGIMVGDEITYDYNFAPFSKKNTQKCLCGSRNCRGILGPKKAESRISKAALAAGKIVDGASRKLLAAFGGKNSAPGTPKKNSKHGSFSPEKKSQDPRTGAGPAVQPKSHATIVQQKASREERANRRSVVIVSSSSRKGLRSSHSVRSFRLSDSGTAERVSAKPKRHSLPLVRAATTLSSMIKSPKAPKSAIASRTSEIRKTSLSLPTSHKSPKPVLSKRNSSQGGSAAKLSKSLPSAGDDLKLLKKPRRDQTANPSKRVESGSTIRQYLMSNSLRQSRLSFDRSSSNLSFEVPDAPTSSLRHSSRAHKPSPKMRDIVGENESTISKKKPISLKLDATTKRDIWEPESDMEDEGPIWSGPARKRNTADDKTPQDSPRRLSGRTHKPSPKVLANALAESTTDTVNRKAGPVLSKRPGSSSSAISNARPSLGASVRNVLGKAINRRSLA